MTDPLAHRHVRDDLVHQVRRRLRHVPGTARRAEPAPLAAECHQLVVAAVAAAQAQEAVSQDAAFKEGFELVLDELRQIGVSGGLSFGEVDRGMLLHQGCGDRRLPGLISSVGLTIVSPSVWEVTLGNPKG